jgi:hypothetical protein
VDGASPYGISILVSDWRFAYGGLIVEMDWRFAYVL